MAKTGRLKCKQKALFTFSAFRLRLTQFEMIQRDLNKKL